ncbi:hypothetical protein, partial [Gelidibacter algens]|uniref:hypothetical protein n=1 Tax=Gelidibacter algens TaxID=49280 RepID=UPI001B801F37
GNGIARFDGSSFTNYEYFNENDTDYKIGFVNSVVIDKFGKKLFIASEEGFFIHLSILLVSKNLTLFPLQIIYQ